jgi:hypothetical protein
MPNWLHLVTNLLYHAGLAVWIGGAALLGALVAPALFRALPRQEAGRIFGGVLRKFARLRLAAILAVIAAAAVKHLLWERNATGWISIRWGALAFMAFAVLYEIAWLERAVEARRLALRPEMEEEHPARRAFAALHTRAERLLKGTVIAALAATLLS